MFEIRYGGLRNLLKKLNKRIEEIKKMEIFCFLTPQKSLKIEKKDLNESIRDVNGLAEAFFTMTQNLESEIQIQIQAAPAQARQQELKSQLKQLESRNQEILDNLFIFEDVLTALPDIPDSTVIFNDAMEVIRNAKLELECIVCKAVSTSEVYQCQAGHLICSKCFPTFSQECPLRCGFILNPQSKIRSRLAEKIGELLNAKIYPLSPR